MKHFKLEEFNCTHTGKNEMDSVFLEAIDELRERCGFPFTITSGYRDITHPVEAKKAVGGTHTQGIAADIAVRSGAEKYTIVKHAMELGFTGIGVANTFVHVDTRTTTPVIWTY
jgi:uncharacterized protein YcbK (DUF882 family)